jgi:hypothetical protein
MKLLGVLAGAKAVANDRIFTYPDQAAGLADPAALGDVSQDRYHTFLGQAGVEQRGAFALGKAGLTDLAIEEAALFGAVAHADRQIAARPLAVVGTVGVLTTKTAQVIRVHRLLGLVQG